MPINTVRLDVDLAARTGAIKPLHGVNLGPISNAGWTDNSNLFKELAFPHVRLHDCPAAVAETVDVHSIFPLFHLDENDPRNYRFAITDDYLQSIIDTGCGIVYRLGESLEHFTRRKHFVHPPKDFDKWAAICVNIIRHYNEGWADGFHHGIRYWEIWNEPWTAPLNWTGSDQDYYRLYEVAAKAIKAHDPELMVGGPTALGSAAPNKFETGFLEHCRATDTPLDFYSWHLYTREPVCITDRAKLVKELLAHYGYGQAESHLNEWNYLPPGGFPSNAVKQKNPELVRSGFEEVIGIQGAVFDAAVLIYMQDCQIDVANYYWVFGGWPSGLVDLYGVRLKTYHAFKAFRALLDTPNRVRTTVTDPHTGYALLAGVADEPRAEVLLANCRARESDFVVAPVNWPWSGGAVCKRYLLDYDRDLTLVGQSILDENNPTVNLCVAAPAVCRLTLEPADDVRGDRKGGAH